MNAIKQKLNQERNQRLNELNKQKAQYGAMYTNVTETLRQRKEHLKLYGLPVSEDAEIKELRAKSGALNSRLQEINAQIARMAPVRPARTQGKLFAGCTKHELRILGKLIDAVGEAEYKQIVKDAKEEQRMAERQQKAIYLAEDDAEFKKLDKMMRNNYNKFAGDEI